MFKTRRSEVLAHRRVLRQFLHAEPLRIIIQRPTITTTAAGGKVKSNPQDLAPQTFRLIPFKKRLTTMTRDTPDGNIVNLPYVLLGEHDADVQPGDSFEHNGGIYDVVSIEPNTSYRVAANVTYRGKKNTWG